MRLTKSLMKLEELNTRCFQNDEPAKDDETGETDECGQLGK